jgi:hypothetical protein
VVLSNTFGLVTTRVATVVVTIQVQSAPTDTPEPTATPTGPHILTGATLGGTQSAFMAAFGAPVMTATVAHYNFTLPDGTQGNICFCTTATGLDGLQHLDLSGMFPNGPSWNSVQAQEAVKLFSPPDTVYVKTIPTSEIGPITVYLSADLAKTFPASEFVDSDTQTPLPPGTFSVACQRPGEAGCSIVTGT